MAAGTTFVRRTRRSRRRVPVRAPPSGANCRPSSRNAVSASCSPNIRTVRVMPPPPGRRPSVTSGRAEVVATRRPRCGDARRGRSRARRRAPRRRSRRRRAADRLEATEVVPSSPRLRRRARPRPRGRVAIIVTMSPPGEEGLLGAGDHDTPHGRRVRGDIGRELIDRRGRCRPGYAEFMVFAD